MTQQSLIHVLNAQADRLTDRPALWSKRGGMWLAISWREYARRVRDCALGLANLGLSRGEIVAIVGGNREEWLVAHLAVMACGAIPTALGLSASPSQRLAVLKHSSAAMLIAENQATLSRSGWTQNGTPGPRLAVVMDPTDGQPGVVDFAEVMDRGSRTSDVEYYDRLNELRPSAMAQINYTSGTTSEPKAVMLSHQNLLWTAERLALCADTTEDDALLSYWPLEHIAEQMSTIVGALKTGIQVYLSGSIENLGEHLREVRPTLFFSVPKVWERFWERIEVEIDALQPAQQRMVRWARGVASRIHADAMSHRQSELGLQAQYQIARRTVFGLLKERIGFNRTRLFASTAAPIRPATLESFASIDILIGELYGQTELTGPTAVSVPGALKFGRVGRPMPGVEVKIAFDGEILVRGGNTCLGYFKDPRSTNQLLENGWLHTGDLGSLDEEGFLRVAGRKKELIVT
jgi:long-chain acyl-CoA synthetase